MSLATRKDTPRKKATKHRPLSSISPEATLEPTENLTPTPANPLTIQTTDTELSGETAVGGANLTTHRPRLPTNSMSKFTSNPTEKVVDEDPFFVD